MILVDVDESTLPPALPVCQIELLVLRPIPDSPTVDVVRPLHGALDVETEDAAVSARDEAPHLVPAVHGAGERRGAVVSDQVLVRRVADTEHRPVPSHFRAEEPLGPRGAHAAVLLEGDQVPVRGIRGQPVPDPLTAQPDDQERARGREPLQVPHVLRCRVRA